MLLTPSLILTTLIASKTDFTGIITKASAVYKASTNPHTMDEHSVLNLLIYEHKARPTK